MKYVGSKNRLGKDLAPIIQSYIDDNHITNYWEPMRKICGMNTATQLRFAKMFYGHIVQICMLQR